MKRTLIIVAVALVYVMGISYSLAYLPFADTPACIKPFFLNKLYGTLAWMEIRQKVTVIFLGVLLSLLLVKYDRKNALFDAFAIGVVSFLIGIISNWIFYRQYDLSSGGPYIFTLVEVTDYLAVGLAIPAIVATILKLIRPRGEPKVPGTG